MTSSDVRLQTVAFTAQQVREAESKMMLDTPSDVLMGRAAFGCAVLLRRQLKSFGVSMLGAKLVALVGKGNNGGDTLFVVADCAKRGARVDAVVIGGTGKVHQAGLLAAMNAGVRVHELESITGQVDPTRSDLVSMLRDADVVLDGLLGIGSVGPMRNPILDLICKINESGSYCVAIDVPTGVDATTGELDASGMAVNAALTVTFGALKTGLLTGPGAACAGQVELVDIGLGPYLPGPVAKVVSDDDIDELILPAHRMSDKYSRGVVGVIAGSEQYPGAALLAVGAARQSGVGMVRYAGPCAAEVVARYPDVIATSDINDAGRVQAWLVGPGLGMSESAQQLMTAALASLAPLIIDADGLNLMAKSVEPKVLAKRTKKGWPTFLTPHQGEAERLRDKKKVRTGMSSGRPLAGRVELAKELANRWSSICVLKGVGTVVAAPVDEVVWIDRLGDQSLATAGSGDVLAGFLAGLAANQLANQLAKSPQQDPESQIGKSEQQDPDSKLAKSPQQSPDSKLASRMDWSRIAAVAVAWHALAGRSAASSSSDLVTAPDVLGAMGAIK